MKPLANHTLIYDGECPMCNAYSKVFVKTGMLDNHGREAFTDLRGQIPEVDWNRAGNEIALVNREDKTVRYGVDSLLAIMENSLPFVRPVLRFRPVYFLLRRLYFFISYNRKVMAPGKEFESDHACKPSMNYPYRIAYLLFAWLVTSVILVRYFALGAPIVPASGFGREFLVCAGQLVFQGIIVACFRRDRVIHYLGNVMTVSLAGALALAPVLLLTGWIQTQWIYIGYFMVVVAFMFFEHKRRVCILELPVLISYSWVLYRFLILFTVIL
ncbi:MAG TPA: DCC1-like thiol-disulfide oxidoreductase family protein [Cyclobacteriaceae bacterium]|nr:DCC1-like thiol-disulfide oxidoreductase family protein [Cyclobacteriaceae bacterium]